MKIKGKGESEKKKVRMGSRVKDAHLPPLFFMVVYFKIDS